MALPHEEQGERRRGRPRRKPPAEALETAVGKWAGYAREAVDGTWPLRRDAEQALGTEHARLSRLLPGEGLSPKEWLDALHEAREAATAGCHSRNATVPTSSTSPRWRPRRPRNAATGNGPEPSGGGRGGPRCGTSWSGSWSRPVSRKWEATYQLRQAEQQLVVQETQVEEIWTGSLRQSPFPTRRVRQPPLNFAVCRGS